METFLVHGPVDRISILEKQVRSLLEWQRIMSGSGIRSYGAESPASTIDEILLSSARDQDVTMSSDIKIPLQSQPEKPGTLVAVHILDILERYGHNTTSSKQTWLGKLDFLPAIQKYVDTGTPVRMILPAFPFKSPNKVEKVMGALPDLGEELALAHLNGLCTTITELYQPGAEITILSDGLVYSDILGVPDQEVWAYGESLREMATSKGLQHIRFARIVDLLEIHDNLDKDQYTTHASCYRRELIAKFGDPNFDVRRQISDDKDTCMTYRGYLKFLTVDLKRCSSIEVISTKGRFKKHVKEVATAMIVRGKIFAKALQSGFSDYVRLSIHPSTGKTKLPIQLIPQSANTFGMTPWHCSIAVGIDSSYRTVHAADVALTHDLVHRNGRPYCFREKSDLYDWGEMKVSFEHLYPCGLIVRPSTGIVGQSSLRDIDMAKLRGLSESQCPIIVRGLMDTNEWNLFISKAHKFGKVVSPLRGADGRFVPEEKVLKGISDAVVDIDNAALPTVENDVVPLATMRDSRVQETTEGLATTLKAPDSTSPRFELSTYTSTPPTSSPPTLFAASRLFFQHLPFSHTAETLEAVMWRTPDAESTSTANTSSAHALVVRHPVHKTPCLRWHDQWAVSETQLPRMHVAVENASQNLAGMVDRLLGDRRVCLRFACETGDLVVYDSLGVLRAGGVGASSSDGGVWRVGID